MHCSQELHKRNAGNVNNIGLESCRHFRNMKREYLKAKVDEFQINCEKTNTAYDACLKRYRTF